jgi:hypothetical protein
MENCALKLVSEVVLCYDARSKKHQNIKRMFLYVEEDVTTASKAFLSCHVFSPWSFSSIHISRLRNRTELCLKKADLRSSVAILQLSQSRQNNGNTRQNRNKIVCFRCTKRKLVLSILHYSFVCLRCVVPV